MMAHSLHITRRPLHSPLSTHLLLKLLRNRGPKSEDFRHLYFGAYTKFYCVHSLQFCTRLMAIIGWLYAIVTSSMHTLTALQLCRHTQVSKIWHIKSPIANLLFLIILHFCILKCTKSRSKLFKLILKR